ncbi:MAG: Rpn family recombination-promoting nuclease/putative transposase [Rickettsiella sp.]|nr:Rpn family recombination-promoting nuclease/putative transposase [Rickettsiella sp.]
MSVVNSFFQAYLPEKIKKRCDFSTHKIEPGSFIDDNLSQHHSDILYSLNIEGHKGYIYIDVEHQSTPQELMPIRMFRYKLGITKQHLDQRHKKAPAVIPIIFYHGERLYPYSLKLIDCFEDKEFAKEHFFDDPLLVDLNLKSDDEFYKHKKLGLLELVQKHIFKRDLDNIVGELVKLVESTQPEHDLFNGLVYYMLLIGQTRNVNRVIEKLRTIENYEEDVMNAAQQLQQQGRREEDFVIAKRMLDMGADVDFIKKATQLSDQYLLSLED